MHIVQPAYRARLNVSANDAALTTDMRTCLAVKPSKLLYFTDEPQDNEGATRSHRAKLPTEE